MARRLHSLTHSLTHLYIFKDIRGFLGSAGFPILFTFAVLFALTAGHFLPSSIDEALGSLTSRAAVLLARGIGLDAFVEGGAIIGIESKRLSIIPECSAIGYVFIFAAAVAAYPSSLRKKAAGLLFCVPIILFLNLLRIVFLGWLGGHYPEHFDIFHTWLWEAGFMLAVVLIWMGWVNIPARSADLRARRDTVFSATARLLLLAALAYPALWFSSGQQRLIAGAAESVVHAAGFEGFVRSYGMRLMIIFSPGGYREIWAGAYYILPFVVLTVLFPGRRIAGPLFGAALRLAAGIILLTLAQIAAVVLFFAIIRSGGGFGLMAMVDAAARLSPVFLWLILSRPMRRELESETVHG